MRKLTRFIRVGALATLPAALMAIAIPQAPAQANDFRGCVRRLVNTGINQEIAGRSCAQALVPGDLSDCVADIKGTTELKPEDILSACYRVRRPTELASCVVTIDRRLLRGIKPETTEGTGSNDLTSLALDNCRRSLLPERYSECVTGYAGAASEATPAKAMEVCISAESVNRDYSPNATN